MRSKVVDRLADKLIVRSDYIRAEIGNCFLGLNGLGSPQQRLGEPVFFDALSQAALGDRLNLCVFVAYSSESSLSTLSYLEALFRSGFSIVFVNNQSTSRAHLASIRHLCLAVYDRRNIGRDIGAYKDAILQLHESGLLARSRSLCLANDSMQFVPGANADQFVGAIKQFLAGRHAALFSHASHQISRHYQSFFQVLKPEVFRSSAFLEFWRRYRPISSRAHCIRLGELELSRRVYNHIASVDILYTVDRLLDVLSRCSTDSGPISADVLLGMMPSPLYSMKTGSSNYALERLIEAAKNGRPLDLVGQHFIADLFLLANPSHLGAFLFVKFLGCPLVKKDLCLGGTYTPGKALFLFAEALRSSGCSPSDVRARLSEYRSVLAARGIPSDYRRKPIARALGGVSEGFVYSVD